MAKLGASNQKLQNMVLELYRSSPWYNFLKNQMITIREDYELDDLPEYHEHKYNEMIQKEIEEHYVYDHPEENFEYDENWEPVPIETDPIKKSLNRIYVVRDLEEHYKINYLTLRNRWGEFFQMIKYVHNWKKLQWLTLRFDVLLWIVTFDLLEKDTQNTIGFLFKQ